MALELKPVQVRLSEDAYRMLKLCADAEGKDLGEKARELLHLLLLGAGHGVIEAHERLTRAVGNGKALKRALTDDQTGQLPL